MLEFDAATHTYRWKGAKVPHVTGVLAPFTDYSHIPADTLKKAQDEGIAIHRMVELDCQDELDVDGLPEWLRGYHKAWKLFVEETGFSIESSEERVYHPTLGYAGTLDLCGMLTHTGPEIAIIDVKRSFYAGAAIGLQTWAYLEARNTDKERLPASKRFALQLRPNGTYRLQEFKDRADKSVWLAALTIYRWRERNEQPH